MSALPNSAQYSLKPSLVKITRRTHLLPSLNKRTYSMGPQSSDNIILYIPSLNDSVMDGQSAVFRYTLRIVNGGAQERSFNLDNGSWCVLDTLRFFSNSNQLLEEIQQYNVLYSALVDAQVDVAQRIANSTTWGTEEVPFTVINTGADLAGGANVTAVGATAQNTSFEGRIGKRSNARRGRSIVVPGNSTVNVSFCIPIISSFFQLAEKYIPSFAFADDLRCEIQLATVTGAFVSADVSNLTFTIEQPEISVDYLHMDPQTLAVVQQSYAGRDLVLSTTSYKSYTSIIEANSEGNLTQILPSKLVSAKMLLGVYRRTADITSQTAYSLSSRVSPFDNSNDAFNLNLGGTLVPQQRIQVYNDNELDTFRMELDRAFHSLGVLTMDGCLSRDYYSVNSRAAGAYPAPGADLLSYRNAFLLGLNLDGVIKASDTIMGGYDLSKITSYTEMRLNAPGPAVAITATYFILHDFLLVLDSIGNAVSRF